MLMARLFSRCVGAAILLVACALLVGGCASPPSTGSASAPTAPSYPSDPSIERAESDEGMVAAAHPRAVEAGVAALEDGGTAVDAAVTTAFALGVLEPMMGGIGGGGSMTLWDPDGEEARFIDFYASAGADPDSGLGAVPDSLRSRERMVAVPGTVDGLLEAHDEHGVLSRRRVLAPAIRLAREGFPVHPLLARIIDDYEERLTYDDAAAAVFYPDGEPLQAGDRLVRPALATTLERIAAEGRAGFYEGPTASAIIDRLDDGGTPLTTDDLAAYESRTRAPLCGTYGPYTVLSATPSLNGAEVIETLNLLEPYDLPARGLPAESAEALGPLVDAIRIARADRRRWIGDPDETGVPAVGLASEAFADQRRSRMGTAPVPDSMAAGNPWPHEASGRPDACAVLGSYPPTPLPRPEPSANGTMEEDPNRHTSHISIVDAEGRAVSLTFTMGLYFGSAVFVDGFFLNSAALNFEEPGGRPVANRRAPRRTPRSSTAPTILLEDGTARLVVGSPGSGRIPPAIVHMVTYTLDYGLDPAAAVRMPRVYPFVTEPHVRVEDGVSAPALSALRDRGYTLETYPPQSLYFGGVHMVYVDDTGRRIGVADPRRNGTARGQ
jgi:gamma-glutamyltranspeptidase/glutathione hydrolase